MKTTTESQKADLTKCQKRIKTLTLALKAISDQCDAYAKCGIGYDRDIDIMAKKALKKANDGQ